MKLQIHFVGVLPGLHLPHFFLHRHEAWIFLRRLMGIVGLDKGPPHPGVQPAAGGWWWSMVVMVGRGNLKRLGFTISKNEAAWHFTKLLHPCAMSHASALVSCGIHRTENMRLRNHGPKHYKPDVVTISVVIPASFTNFKVLKKVWIGSILRAANPETYACWPQWISPHKFHGKSSEFCAFCLTGRDMDKMHELVGKTFYGWVEDFLVSDLIVMRAFETQSGDHMFGWTWGSGVSLAGLGQRILQL